jgi:hypothetical protein
MRESADVDGPASAAARPAPQTGNRSGPLEGGTEGEGFKGRTRRARSRLRPAARTARRAESPVNPASRGSAGFDRTIRESTKARLETANPEARNGSMSGKPERLRPERMNWLNQGNTAGFGRLCGTDSRRGESRAASVAGEEPARCGESQAASAAGEESQSAGNHEMPGW